LRIFERSLADLECRLKDTESAAARSSALSEQTAKAVFDRFEAFEHEQREAAQSLTARMEETERRQRGATAEMRAAVNDAATRIEILEAARRADNDTARKSEGIPQEHPSSAQRATPSPEPVTEIAEQEGYHAAAQRAASAAALLAGMRDRAEKTEAQRSRYGKKVQLYRKHYLLGACFVLLAFAVGAFVAFYAGQARGRQLAISPGATSNHVSTRVPQIAPTHAAARNSGTAASPDLRARLAAFAQAGNANAEFLLGLGFLHGEGVAPDQAEGARWIRRAAEQRDPIAEYYLGALYEHGNGVNRDGTEAIRWYQSAAMQGNRKAMHALGIAYAQGEGITKDYTEAARWFSKAAEHGLVNSQFNLAVLYERGLGVRQSLLDAYKWYAIAAASGDQESRKRLDALKTQLGADDLAAGERAARAFAPKNENAAANNPPALADLLSRQSH
jgi:TPR repeat protein